jgi:glucose 1-dehydrogenase
VNAITVVPGQPDQVHVSDLPDPQAESGTLLVQGRLLGICGTDLDIVENGYGRPPPGRDRLVIGHESLGTVRRARGQRIHGWGPGRRHRPPTRSGALRSVLPR